MNLPNKLTLFRIFLIPIIMIVYAIPSLREMYIFSGFAYLSMANFIILMLVFIGSITDFLDGKIARKYNLITDLGKFLDPLADKLLVITSLVILVDEGFRYDNQIFTWWMLIIVLARDFMVTGIRLIAAGKQQVIAASWYGKIKTTLQFITIIFLFAGCARLKDYTLIDQARVAANAVYVIIAKIFIVLMLTATIFSGADYLIKNIGVFKESDSNKKSKKISKEK